MDQKNSIRQNIRIDCGYEEISWAKEEGPAYIHQQAIWWRQGAWENWWYHHAFKGWRGCDQDIRQRDQEKERQAGELGDQRARRNRLTQQLNQDHCWCNCEEEEWAGEAAR